MNMKPLLVLGILGVATIAKCIFDGLENAAGKQKREWATKKDELFIQVKEAENHLINELERIQTISDFELLRSVYIYSIQTADQAFNLLNSSRMYLNELNSAKKRANEEISRLNQIKRTCTTTEEREKYETEIAALQVLLKQLYDDGRKTYQERKDFLDQVRRLNAQTKRLREHIRDNCGWRGQRWYNQIETRKSIKRQNISSQKF